MRVAMGYATATLTLIFCRCSSTAASTAASSASRSSGKAAEALAGPAHRQRKPGRVFQGVRSMEAQNTSAHVPKEPNMKAQFSPAKSKKSFGSPARQLLKDGASDATHRPQPSSTPPLVSFW